MSQLAHILEFRPQRAVGHTADWEAMFPAQPARLVIGSHSESARKSKYQEIAQDGELPGGSAPSSRFGQKLALYCFPESLKMVHPRLLGTVMVDLLLIGGALSLAARSSKTPVSSGFATVSYLLLYLVLAVQEGLYRNRTAPLAQQRPLILKTLLWTTVVATLAGGASMSLLLPLALAAATSFCALLFTRWFWNSLCGSDRVENRRNVLVIGNSIFQCEIKTAIELDPHSGRSVKALLSERDFQSARGPAMLRKIARQQFVDEVILAAPNADMAENALQTARGSHLDVSVVHSFPSAEPIAAERVGWITLLKLYAQPFPEQLLAAKRLVDVATASALLVLTSPLLLLIALGIKLDSRGPVLYRAQRIGYRGHRFICNKFRTMTTNADAEKDSLRSRNERNGAFFKIVNDPRITRFGHFLRRYSLDELPQLWNVLRGEMSLIGPRPHPPDDVSAYGIEDLQRLDCVPGMTGLWQVTARQDPSFERCVALDAEYIKHWSPLLDIRILCRTFRAVLQGGGA